jgi:hypothetical protein
MLQSSGAISIDNIRTELGQAQANSSLRTLSSLAGKSTPDAMSEFYGYSNVTATAYTFYVGDGGVGYSDWTQACGEAYDPVTLYSSSTSLAVGVILYKGSDLQNIQNGEGLWWKSGNSVYEIRTDGSIQSVRGC